MPSSSSEAAPTQLQASRALKPLSYGRQWIEDDDIAAVIEALRSDALTGGPRVARFEQAFAAVVGTAEAVAVCNGTAALHSAYAALQIQPGDEVIVPTMTFSATANAAVLLGARPVFVDVQPETLLIEPTDVEAKITPRTKAIVAVDYAGQPCDYDALRRIADRNHLALVADACHALGGAYKGKPVGRLADLSTFSFHPVKPIATGEGGMITTDDAVLARRMRQFRNHGITTEARDRERNGTWFYEMVGLGNNYRLSDIHCALGISQLRKLPSWSARRRALAARYDAAFAALPGLRPLATRTDVVHAYHLYVVRLDLSRLRLHRAEIYRELRERGLGVNVHYIPVHLQPFYRERFDTKPGMCPAAEQAYEEILTLPLFPQMSDADADDVIQIVTEVIEAAQR